MPDSMLSNVVGQRDLKRLLRAFRRPSYYRAFANSFAVYNDPVDCLKRYLTGRGIYPTAIGLRTPIGSIAPTLYSWHDILTVNEIFCRLDYRTKADARVIVDFGSNIGLSALYFLTRNLSSRCYLFEPVPANIDRLKRNLHGFEDRYVLAPVAIALANGECSFGTEPTGRYGGIAVANMSTITVPCRRANDILETVLADHHEIDVLKIDIEGLEKDILADIPDSIRRKVKCIYAEADFGGENPYKSWYTYRQHGSVATFTLRA
jgi:FkbM family methyltransferase